MTTALRVAGPAWQTYSPEEVMESFASEHRTRIGLIETDGRTFQLLSLPGVCYRVDDYVSGWAVVRLVPQ